MKDDHVHVGEKAARPPWNKGKLVGAKPPLRPSHVWSIRTKLQVEGLKRDLALFNLAIDSKLRGCDVVAVRVDTWHPMAIHSIVQRSARRRRAGRRGSTDDQTRQAIDEDSGPIAESQASRRFPVAATPGAADHRQYARRRSVGGQHQTRRQQVGTNSCVDEGRPFTVMGTPAVQVPPGTRRSRDRPPPRRARLRHRDRGEDRHLTCKGECGGSAWPERST